jgi:hypothetical protein
MKMNEMTAFAVAPLLSLALLACGADGAPNDHQDDPRDSAQAQEVAGHLEVELRALEEGTALLEYRLSNPGEAALEFLEWDTAARGALSDLFDVRREGKPVAYVGPRIHFAEPLAESYVELGPGESMTQRIDLAALYDMREPGQYSVRASARAAALLTDGSSDIHAQVLVPEAALTVSVDEGAVSVPVAGEPQSVDKALQPQCIAECEANCQFAGDPAAIGLCMSACPLDCNPRPTCTLNADNTLNTAMTDRNRMVAAAIPAVDGSPEYSEWFGNSTPARQATVRDALNFTRTDIVAFRQVCLAAGTVIFPSSGAGCAGGSVTKPVNAATGGPLGSNVVFCPSYFGLSAEGRAGVLVHESVHHLGIEDITNAAGVAVISPALARQLADDDADAAIRSGENYENYVIEFF